MEIGPRWHRFAYSKWVLFCAAAGITALLISVVISIHDFLAVHKPVGEGILVVEAWIPAQTLAESARAFQLGHYRCLAVVGGPIPGMSSQSNDSMTYADLAATRLRNFGIDSDKLVQIKVPAQPTGFRTLASAAAVKRWLDSSRTSVFCVDVFTVGVHARKSWVFFRYALGDRYRVGIIAGSEASYDRSRFWFFSTRGIWIFARSLAGYVYSKVWTLSDGKTAPYLSPRETLAMFSSAGPGGAHLTPAKILPFEYSRRSV